MLGVLLAKDLRRVWRNPWPWILNLSLPIAITALVGLAFGGRGEPQVAKIKLALVDEDQSTLGSLLKSGLNQGDGAKYLEVIHASRTEATKAIQDNKISAVFLIPTNFTADFLAGDKVVALEVIKNPAERFYPAIVEELVAAVVTGLNAVHRNFQSDFPRIRAALTGDFDLLKLGQLTTDLGYRVSKVKEYLYPPLVQYRKQVVGAEKKKEGPGFSVFAFILPGMASAFLLFLADHSMRDLHREKRLHTLDRLRSIRSSMTLLVVEKVVYTSLSVLIGSFILFAGGAILFGIHWGSPVLLAVTCLSYAVFAAGLMAFLVAVIGSERKAETMNSMIFFAIAFAGGSYFPIDQMPAFMRERVAPLMPNFWFIETVRGLQTHPGISSALLAVLKLAALGAVMAVLASFLLQRRLTAGERA